MPPSTISDIFFFNDTATTEIYTLSLHDALPISPAILVLWAPGGFRVTCYYYRKSYYRSLLGRPPACAVRDMSKKYKGETRFPFVLQNLHRYFFWLATIFLVFLWWDAVKAFRFRGGGFGIGIGSLVLTTK